VLLQPLWTYYKLSRKLADFELRSVSVGTNRSRSTTKAEAANARWWQQLFRDHRRRCFFRRKNPIWTECRKCNRATGFGFAEKTRNAIAKDRRETVVQQDARARFSNDRAVVYRCWPRQRQSTTTVIFVLCERKRNENEEFQIWHDAKRSRGRRHASADCHSSRSDWQPDLYNRCAKIHSRLEQSL